MNIDGVKKNPTYKPRPKIAVLTSTQRRKTTPKHIKLLSFVDHKQLVTILVTFFVTFAFSIATSQGLASFSQPETKTAATPTVVEQAQNATTVSSFSVVDHPQMLTLDDTVLSKPGEVYLPKEKLSLPDPLKKRKEFLEKYLGAKHSPLADHVDAISEQSQWKLIIAISRAESSFCKHQVTNNCWGIGGAWNMRNYKNYDEAVADVNRILEKMYINAGLDTPKEIVKKYVGHESPNWQAAVEQELENLSEVE